MADGNRETDFPVYFFCSRLHPKVGIIHFFSQQLKLLRKMQWKGALEIVYALTTIAANRNRENCDFFVQD